MAIEYPRLTAPDDPADIGKGWVFNGTVAALASATDPTMGGDLTGPASAAQIAAGAIVNADINASAAIALSKLASDPLARANHTGTQTASTISDFNTAASGASAAGAATVGGDLTGTVANAQIAASAVGPTELATNAVTNAKVADDAIGIDELSATGTPSSSTYLRGDNSWATPAGGGAVATDTLWDAAGDLAVGTGADTAAKLTKGTAGLVLVAGASTVGYAASGYSRTTFSNANVTIVAADKYVAQTGTMSASRTATLPAANAVGAGYEITVADESGTVTSVNTIVITRAGSDTINGATTETIQSPFGMRTLISDGTSKWTWGLGVGTDLPQQRASGATSGVFPSVPGVIFSTVTTRAMSADRIHYHPFTISDPCLLTEMWIEVTTGAATNAALAVYEADTSMQPGNLVTSGTVVTSTTGIKKVTGLTAALKRGHYVMRTHFDGTPTVRVMRGGGIHGSLFPTLGTDPWPYWYYKALTYTGTPESPGTAWVSGGNANLQDEYWMFLLLTT